MVATPKSSLFLGLCCILAIAATGCVFELSSGVPDLGTGPTAAILATSLPASILCFVLAVRAAREAM
jgi:hypothetical protein